MKTQCPECNAVFSVPDVYQGRTIKCTACKKPLTATAFQEIIIAAPPREPEPKPEPVVETPEPKIPELTEEERKPLLLVLDKNKEQGVYDEIPGVLRRANPGLYKLVLIVGDLEEPICLVRGNEDQMKRYLNRALLIKGKKYWAKDVARPVLKVEKIHLDPILMD